MVRPHQVEHINKLPADVRTRLLRNAIIGDGVDVRIGLTAAQRRAVAALRARREADAARAAAEAAGQKP